MSDCTSEPTDRDSASSNGRRLARCCTSAARRCAPPPASGSHGHVVALLALGIGANSAIFSAIDAVQLVASRRREIGVRIALGARPSQVLSSVVAQATAMAGAGLVLALVAAVATIVPARRAARVDPMRALRED